MIGEGIISAFVAFVKFVLGLFPTSDAPSILQGANGALATVWAYGAGLGAWIPWTLVGNVVAAVMVSVGVGFTIKVVRIIASFFTAGGGSAA